MSITTIAAGLSGLKSAGEMIKVLREGLKSGALKADELYGRIGEIYDYIVDSKAALVDAQDEIQALKRAIEAFSDDKVFRDSLTFIPAGYYQRNSSAGMERYCSACLDKDGSRIRLIGQTAFVCTAHGYRQFD